MGGGKIFIEIWAESSVILCTYKDVTYIPLVITYYCLIVAFLIELQNTTKCEQKNYLSVKPLGEIGINETYCSDMNRFDEVQDRVHCCGFILVVSF
jgi:hypothetical protein